MPKIFDMGRVRFDEPDPPALRIVVASYNRALVRVQQEPFDATVSLHGPGDEKRLPDATLAIQMRDVTPNRKAYRGLPTGNDVLRLIDFARTLSPGSRVLVHCAAGRSRSPSAAMIMHAATGAPTAEAVEWTFDVAPKSNPNGWLLKLGDAILGCDLFRFCRTNYRVKW